MSLRLAPPPMPSGAASLGAWWDESAAQKACDFFPRYLRHTEAEWAGHPFRLADWQRDNIVRPLFGWKRADGTRLIRIVWLEVPKKNGKALALDTPIPTLADYHVGGPARIGRRISATARPDDAGPHHNRDSRHPTGVVAGRAQSLDPHAGTP